MATGTARVTIWSTCRRLSNASELTLTIKNLGRLKLQSHWDFIDANLNPENMREVEYHEEFTNGHASFYLAVSEASGSMYGLQLSGEFHSCDNLKKIEVDLPLRFDWGSIEILTLKPKEIEEDLPSVEERHGIVKPRLIFNA